MKIKSKVYSVNVNRARAIIGDSSNELGYRISGNNTAEREEFGRICMVIHKQVAKRNKNVSDLFWRRRLQKKRPARGQTRQHHLTNHHRSHVVLHFKLNQQSTQASTHTFLIMSTKAGAKIFKTKCSQCHTVEKVCSVVSSVPHFGLF